MIEDSARRALGHRTERLGFSGSRRLQHRFNSLSLLLRRLQCERWQNYENWGMNTVDNTVALLRESRPYFAATNFAKTAKYYGNRGQANLYEFPDVFGGGLIRLMEQAVAEFCSNHAHNKNLIAYYWTDTPTWDLHKTRRFRDTDWVSQIRRLPAEAPGRSDF